jgi:arginine N-succinyltransferase
VRAIIGQVGPETRGVEKILRRIGFEYAGQIDPFDGGPHFTAKTDDITLVKDARQVRLATVDDADGERPWAILAVEHPAQKPGFRAVSARIIAMEDGRVGVTPEVRARLAIEGDEMVWMVQA